MPNTSRRHDPNGSWSNPPVEPQLAAANSDPWAESPITQRFRDEIGRRESQVDGYRAYNPTGGAMGAFGRYQLRQGALIDAGFVDSAGQWTGAMGVNSAADFLGDPRAQEAAFAAYIRANRQRLSMDPVGHRNIGQKVFNSKKGNFTITEGGLMAAAHGQGAGAVRDYLAYARDRDWVSDPVEIEGKEGLKFLEIEKRLREFEGVPYAKPLPNPPRLPPRKSGRGR